VACRFGAADGAQDPAVLADDIGHPFNQSEDDQVRDPDVVQAADPQVRIEEQIEGKRLPGPEFPMRLFGIRADAVKNGLFAGKLVGKVAEPARLGGSAGRAVLRKEEEHDMVLPAVVLQADRLPVLGARREERRDAADLEHDRLRRSGTVPCLCAMC
jgi:hypothetical protein